MKRNHTGIAILAAAALAASSIGPAAAQRHQQGQGQGQQQMQGQMRGQMQDQMQGRMGPGAGMMGPMMGNMQGRGMMGRMMQMMQMSRMMMGPMGPSMMTGAGRPSGDKLSADEARRIADGILAWQGNERLKIGKVTEQDDDTVVIEILTVDDSLVQRVEMNRTTGMITPAK